MGEKRRKKEKVAYLLLKTAQNNEFSMEYEYDYEYEKVKKSCLT